MLPDKNLDFLRNGFLFIYDLSYGRMLMTEIIVMNKHLLKATRCKRRPD